MDQKITCLSVVEVAVEGTNARPELEGGTKAEEGALFARAMTATVMPDELVKLWKPDYVAPMIALLASEGSLGEPRPRPLAEGRWTDRLLLAEPALTREVCVAAPARSSRPRAAGSAR